MTAVGQLDEYPAPTRGSPQSPDRQSTGTTEMRGYQNGGAYSPPGKLCLSAPLVVPPQA